MKAVYGGIGGVCPECGEHRVVDGPCLNCNQLEAIDDA